MIGFFVKRGFFPLLGHWDIHSLSSCPAPAPIGVAQGRTREKAKSRTSNKRDDKGAATLKSIAALLGSGGASMSCCPDEFMFKFVCVHHVMPFVS